MSTWRERKARLHASVHRHFNVAGWYVASMQAAPVPAKVRVHRRPPVERLGMGDFADGGSMLVGEDALIFDMTEVPMPRVDGFFVVDAEEGYKIDAAKPPEMGFVAVTVTPLTPDQLAEVFALING